MSKFKIGLIVITGLIAISFASIFIKLCSAPSLVIAVYRLSIASIFYTILFKTKTSNFWPTFTWSQKKLALISGLFLTLHFATWISSFKYTSVASSVVLVQSAPIFVAVGSAIFLREKPTWQTIIGILITLTGSVIIGVHDFTTQQSSIFGNLLAVGGAIGAAGYMVAGRKLRLDIDTLSYVTVVYSVAAILMMGLAIGSRTNLLGYSSDVYMLLFAIAIVPQIIGHTIINWSLKYFSATTVSIIILAEPIGASILAFSLLGEKLSTLQILGGLTIIIGVIFVLSGEAGLKK